MAEYIEREALIAEYDRVHIGAAGGARKLMIDAPAADVVEVVRCSECQQYTPVEGGKPLCALHNIACSGDDFCSYGERRSEE